MKDTHSYQIFKFKPLFASFHYFFFFLKTYNDRIAVFRNTRELFLHVHGVNKVIVVNAEGQKILGFTVLFLL